MFSETCPSCGGVGGVGGYVGDGWHEPREYEFDPCNVCIVDGFCPSCSTELFEIDADNLNSDPEFPCPFCRWTQQLGMLRDIECGEDAIDWGDE
jgi:hypothetical protein